MEHTLRKGNLVARVNTMGGELISLRDLQDTEYIWQGDPAYWSGQNPILFPIVGGLKAGSVEIGGVSVQMARHGFARRREFAVADQGADFVVFRLEEDQETLREYPFPFMLEVRHQLMENGFETCFSVRNKGERVMPFCVGGHTAFRCPLGPGESFEEYCLVFEQVEDARSILPGEGGCLRRDVWGPALHHTDTLPLTYAVFDEVDTLIFEGLRSKSVRLVHRDSGRGVQMEFSQFPMVAFWTKPHANAPYLCMEPWHGCAAFMDESGRFEDKPHCILLEPGQSRSLRYTVTLLP